eukprot:gene18099-24530_t
MGFAHTKLNIASLATSFGTAHNPAARQPGLTTQATPFGTAHKPLPRQSGLTPQTITPATKASSHHRRPMSSINLAPDTPAQSYSGSQEEALAFERSADENPAPSCPICRTTRQQSPTSQDPIHSAESYLRTNEGTLAFERYADECSEPSCAILLVNGLRSLRSG